MRLSITGGGLFMRLFGLLKLLRESSRTLMDAVKIALAEYDVLKRWELRKDGPVQKHTMNLIDQIGA
jgi:hypothetical protein